MLWYARGLAESSLLITLLVQKYHFLLGKISQDHGLNKKDGRTSQQATSNFWLVLKFATWLR